MVSQSKWTVWVEEQKAVCDACVANHQAMVQMHQSEIDQHVHLLLAAQLPQSLEQVDSTSSESLNLVQEELANLRDQLQGRQQELRGKQNMDFVFLVFFGRVEFVSPISLQHYGSLTHTFCRLFSLFVNYSHSFLTFLLTFRLEDAASTRES